MIHIILFNLWETLAIGNIMLSVENADDVKDIILFEDSAPNSVVQVEPVNSTLDSPEGSDHVVPPDDNIAHVQFPSDDEVVQPHGDSNCSSTSGVHLVRVDFSSSIVNNGKSKIESKLRIPGVKIKAPFDQAVSRG